MQKRAAAAVAVLMITILSAGASAGAIMAPMKRISGDPPRIPLTRAVPVELPTTTPDALVAALYARKSPFLGKVSGYRKGFMPDLARAMAQDAQPGELRVIDFDWRYGAPRRRIRRLKLTTLMDGRTATVTARFRVHHRQEEIRFQLFQRRSGWRIHDVGHSERASWSLRSCLHMRGALLARACDKPSRDAEALKPEPLPPMMHRPHGTPVSPLRVTPAPVTSAPAARPLPPSHRG